MKDPLHLLPPVSRRMFLEKCARSAFGVTLAPALGGLAPAAFAASTGSPAGGMAGSAQGGPGFGSAKRVIFLQLRGGMSHIDTFDPKTGASKGPKGALSTKAGFQISEFLPNIAKVSDKLCVVRSMSAKVGVHAAANYLMRTGYDPRGTIRHPMLGAWGQHYLGASHENLPSSVSINHNSDNGNGFFPATYTPLPIIDPDAGLQYSVPYSGIKTVEERLALVREVDTAFQKRFPDENIAAYNDFYDATVRLMKSTELRAFDLNQESAPTKANYGDSKFARGCLLARRLVESGVRFVEVSSGGWDMHNNLADSMESTGAEFDKAYAALVTDLESRGLLESTLVVVATEFGRKPEFAGSGRGHYPTVFSTVLAGAGIKRGMVWGASDAQGAKVVEKPVSVGELHATIGWAAGYPLETVVNAPNGRPFTVGNKSKPVMGVFA
jgi:Protein of unknown function (DUF1501)